MANNQLKEELILNTQHFDKKIDDVIKRVETLKKKGDNIGGGFNNSMGQMIQKATGFNGSMGSLIGVVGKFSGALGLAMGAGEAFNKMLDSSQTLGDNFKSVQTQVNTVIDNFFQSLANGDFSPFLNGMDNMISKANEAYRAMDDLWNMAQSFSVQNARLNNQFQQNINEIRQKKGSKDPNDQKRVKELTEQNKKIIKQQAEGGVKLYNQTIKGLQSEIAAGTGMNTKITEGAIYRIVENDINNLKDGREKYEREYKEYIKQQEKLQKKYSKKNVGGGLIGKVASSLNPTANYGTEYQRELNKLQNRYGESIAANYLLQRKSDAELQEFNDKLKQGINYQGVAIANQSKMIRYVKETNEEANKTNKKGGGGGKSNKGIEYAINSVGDLENKIAQLRKEIKLQVDSSAIADLNKQIKATQNELDNLLDPKRDIKVDMSVFKNGLFPLNWQKNQINKETPELKKSGNLIEQYQNAQDKIGTVLDLYDMGVIKTAKQAQEEIDSINASLEALGLQAIKVHIETDAEKTFKKVSSVVGDLGASFSSLGESLELPELDVLGVIAQAIANVIAGYAAASEQAATLGPWAWIGFSVAGLAQVASVVAQIHSLSGYANGGVIGGNSYSGDNLLIRANSGEMILNPIQQSNLFNLLDRGAVGGNGGNVQFVIKGKDLHGVLHNYNDKMNKVR